MSEEKTNTHHQLPPPATPQYGTYPGVANYPPPQPVVGFPQPVPPPGASDQAAAKYYAIGYQSVPGMESPWKTATHAPLSFAPGEYLHCPCYDFDTRAKYGSRVLRRQDALIFRGMVTKCGDNRTGDMEVDKTFIWPSSVHLWRDRSTRITWLAVNGIDTMCIVIKKKNVQRLEQELDKNYGMKSFWNAIVSEIEDIEGPNQWSYKSIQKPFAIVSMLKGHSKTASGVADKSGAINFLQEEMKSGAASTYDKTIQTTISAFQRLFNKEFKAAEIRVFAWNRSDLIGRELKEEREDPNIEELLAEMNEPNKDFDMF